MQSETVAMPAQPPLLHLPSPLLTRVALVAIALVLFMAAGRFAGLVDKSGMTTVADFEVFHLVGRLIWAGRIDEGYHAATMIPLERELSGANVFLPWTYPPPFDLFVAPLGLLPLWLAYLAFVGTSLVVYLCVLRLLAGKSFGLMLLATFPALCVTINCGQNGFLTGNLVGLACLGLLNRGSANPAWSGVCLGLMVIKPHLAACLALYTLGTRRWRVAAIAVAVIVVSAALSTAAFGPSVWTAFLNGIAESRAFLEGGVYPLYRMISSYAVMRTLGAPASLAMSIQAVVAALALWSVYFVIRNAVPARQAIGIAVMTTLLVSPYAYDYDLPIYGVGLGLVAPELLRFSSGVEKVVLMMLSWIACGWGIAATLMVEQQYGEAGIPPQAMPLSLGGAALLVLTVLIVRVLKRSWEPSRPERPAVLDAPAAA